MLRQLAAAASALTVAIIGQGVSAPTEADAMSARCAIVNSQTVGGYNWSRIPTRRSCVTDLTYGTSGLSKLVEKQVIVHYSERNTTRTEVAMATVHEMAHQVEYRTTAAHRAKLYGYLSVKNPTGNYFAFNDSYYYSGPLNRWMASPRERLAESVVNCTYNTPNFTGMKLVPRAQCKPFLAEFRASLAIAR